MFIDWSQRIPDMGGNSLDGIGQLIWIAVFSMGCGRVIDGC
jgi:hypothetical protein